MCGGNDSDLQDGVRCTCLQLGFPQHVPALLLSNPMLPSSGFSWLLGASHTSGGVGEEEEEEQIER